MSRTRPYRAWVQRYAAEHAIPLIAAPRDQRKEEVVAPYHRRFKGAGGVVVILTSTEAGRAFVSYTPRSPPSGGDPDYRVLHAAHKRFLHFYFYLFYLLDPVLGPMSLRVGTFLLRQLPQQGGNAPSMAPRLGACSPSPSAMRPKSPSRIQALGSVARSGPVR